AMAFWPQPEGLSLPSDCASFTPVPPAAHRDIPDTRSQKTLINPCQSDYGFVLSPVKRTRRSPASSPGPTLAAPRGIPGVPAHEILTMDFSQSRYRLSPTPGDSDSRSQNAAPPTVCPVRVVLRPVPRTVRPG